MPKKTISVPTTVLALSFLMGFVGCTPKVYKPSASAPLIAAGTTPGTIIKAADAKNHIGEQVTVCGNVASVKTATSGRGEPTFINLDAAYPNQIFTILAWGEDRKNIGELPREGEHVCATGMIQEYRGLPQIVVKSKAQLSR
jgi:DNA/RNA endonuclease YhcR with UshA esterase domain